MLDVECSGDTFTVSWEEMAQWHQRDVQQPYLADVDRVDLG